MKCFVTTYTSFVFDHPFTVVLKRQRGGDVSTHEYTGSDEVDSAVEEASQAGKL